MFSSAFRILRKLRGIRKYPTADKNASIFRLIRQGMPYYLDGDGRALPPLSVFFNINSRCNLKCKMCDVGQQDSNSMFYKNLTGSEAGDLPISAFKKMIDEIKAFSPFISFPATEPLLYKDLVEAVDYTAKSGLRVNVGTNGFLLENLAQDLIAAGLTKFVISLDGPRPVHDRIRGVEGTFDAVIRGIEKVDEYKKKSGKETPYIFLNYVISDENFNSIVEFMENIPLEKVVQVDFRVMFYLTPEMAQLHNKQFGDKYDATPACLAGGVDFSKIDISLLYDQLKTVHERFPDKCRHFFDSSKDALDKYFNHSEEFMDSTRCVFPWYTAQISQQGNLIGPSRCFSINYGSVVENRFMDVWNGEKIREFRKDLKKYGRFPACTRCEGVNF